MFVPNYPVEGLKGAEYNPRRITVDCEELLRASIKDIGFAKPVLVTEAGRLVAGHQRTNAARAIGLTHVPAFVLKELKLADEMTFNQLHNGADIDTVVATVRVPRPLRFGFYDVPAADIEADWKQPGAGVRNSIFRLISRYGAWGCAIVDEEGLVLSSAQYAIACKQANAPLRVFAVDEARADLVKHFFSKEYGAFTSSSGRRGSA